MDQGVGEVEVEDIETGTMTGGATDRGAIRRAGAAVRRRGGDRARAMGGEIPARGGPAVVVGGEVRAIRVMGVGAGVGVAVGDELG